MCSTTATTKPINVKINIQPSTLDNITFLEYIDSDRLLSLINSNELPQKYDDANYSQQLASQLYSNEKHQLEMYLKKYDKKLNCCKVPYKKPKHKLGRVFAYKSLGLTNLSKKTRNTLIKGRYGDFDLANAQPSIVYNICVANNIDCPFNTRYNNDRESILKEVCDTYGVSRTQAKKLFIRLAFFGTMYGWCKLCNISTESKPTSFIEGFIKELNYIADIVKQANPEIYELCRKIKTEKGETNVIGSFFSLYLQEYETRIMECCIQYIITKTDIATHNKSSMKILTYEYDGLKLLKERVELYGGGVKLMNDLEKLIYEETGFIMKFEEKPIEDGYELRLQSIPIENKQLNSIDQIETQLSEMRVDNSFEIVKSKFELNHVKIINKSLFVKKENDQIILMSRSQLTTAYEHLKYNKVIGISDNRKPKIKEQNFIEMWLHYKDIKNCDDVGIYPNNELCPKNIFNMWIPFAMDKNINYIHKEEELQKILHHIMILCNHQEDASEHIIKWIAHMLQKPHEKGGLMPIFIALEGSGKNTLIELLKKMIGVKKVFESSDPCRDVWGNFNSPMKDSFLVHLEELSKKDLIEATGKVKALITNPTLTINQKGISQYSINSYHRFIATTNSEDPITTKKGDRRNFIIRCSDEKKGDHKYFNELYALLEDENVIKTCYEYFKNIDIIDFKAEKFPETEYQNELKEMNENPIDGWLKSMVYENFYKTDDIELLGIDAFNRFEYWKKQNGMEKYEMTCVKLGVRLINMKIKGVYKGKHTNKGFTKIFKIEELKEHYKIGGVDEQIANVIENDDDCDDESVN
jgi:hypothetical protein